MEQVIVNGLYLGAQYALIALGLTLIFALMNVLNFAHGQMYVLGGFITYTVYGQLGLPFVVALARLRRDARGHRRAVRDASSSARSSAAACARRAPCCSRPAIAFFLDAVILLAVRREAARRAEDRQRRLHLGRRHHALRPHRSSACSRSLFIAAFMLFMQYHQARPGACARWRRTASPRS